MNKWLSSYHLWKSWTFELPSVIQVAYKNDTKSLVYDFGNIQKQK
jgi:hypothetical protein